MSVGYGTVSSANGISVFMSLLLPVNPRLAHLSPGGGFSWGAQASRCVEGSEVGVVRLGRAPLGPEAFSGLLSPVPMLPRVHELWVAGSQRWPRKGSWCNTASRHPEGGLASHPTSARSAP